MIRNRDEPACLDADPEWFFRGEREGNTTALRRARHVARTYCAVCPVFDWCARMAEYYQAEGLWAGQWRDRKYTKGRHEIDIQLLLTPAELGVAA